jgi:ferredoxin
MVPQHVSEGSATPVDDEAAGGAAGVDTGKAGTGGDGGVEAGSGGDGGVDAAGGTIGTGGRKVGAVLVVGGGIAGMQASLDLAHSGFKVYLLDSAPAIGGTMAQLDKTFPTNDCSMCIMAPKLVEMGRHHNIELLTYSDLEEVSGEAGNYRVKVKKKARYIDLEACTGCGVCAEHCPIDARSAFNEGLSGRRAIFVPYPQAVPLVFTIEKDRCIGCGLCESLCLAEAIRYDDKDEIVELDVGSIILCPGFDEFDPVLCSAWGPETAPWATTTARRCAAPTPSRRRSSPKSTSRPSSPPYSSWTCAPTARVSRRTTTGRRTSTASGSSAAA